MIPDASDDDAAVWRRHLSLYPRRPRWMVAPEDIVRRVGESLYGLDWPDRMSADLSLPQDLPLPRSRLREWHRRDLLRLIDDRREALKRLRRVVEKQGPWPRPEAW